VKIRTVWRKAIVFLVVFSFAAVGEGVARVNFPPGMGVGLVIDGTGTRIPGKLAFYETDPLPLVLTLENLGGNLITSKGFSGRPFHLYFTFTDPAAKGILADERDSASPTAVHVPPPKVLPVGSDLKQVEAVEILEGTSPGPTWSLMTTIPNAHAFYTLFGNVPYPAGHYSVRAVIPMRTYSQIDYTVDLASYSRLDSVAFQETVSSGPVYFSIIADRDCDGYFFPDGCASCTPPPSCPAGWVAHPEADCDDGNPFVNPAATEVPNGIDDDCNPATPDSVPEARGTIALHAVKYLVGQGSHPTVLPEPLANMPVKIMDMSPGSCVAQQGFNWPNYDAVWRNCLAAGSGATDGSGDLWVTMLPGEYAILGVSDPNPAVQRDELYVRGTAVVSADSTQHVSVQAFVTPSGKFVPGLSTRRTGSELIVVEPEYIEWTGTQEFYPFVFRSVGDWNVSTSVSPPEGFVADHAALETDVNSSLRAVQFVVTDVGSEWKDTKVNHKIRHRGKIKILKSKIGVNNKQVPKEKKK